MSEPSEVVKKSISLSRVVSLWADRLAAAKGFDSNFSAYIADLIRRDKEREDQLRLLTPGVSEVSSQKEIAEFEIASEVRRAARKVHRLVRSK
jgi:hypothetical protein